MLASDSRSSYTKDPTVVNADLVSAEVSFDIPDFDTELDHHLAIGAVNFPASHGVGIYIAAYHTLRFTTFLNSHDIFVG